MYGIPTQPDETPTLLFNPSKDDFEDKIATVDGGQQTLLLPSRVITEFPKYVADHVAKHLARKLALDDDPKRHFEDRYQEWLDKIYVKGGTWIPQKV